MLFAVVSGFILFAGDEALEKIKLNKVLSDHGWIIGLVFVISAGLTTINLILWISKKLRIEWKFHKAKNELRAKLQLLDPQEKSVIREFILRQ